MRSLLPKGQTLPAEVWWSRHHAILALLWCHAAAIPVYAVVQGYALPHIVLEAVIVPTMAVLAGLERIPVRARTVIASLGLLSSSAVLVHLSGGLIEMHFHFFVMVAVVALYQDWLPFLTAIVYVLVHHGVIGALDPHSVFNHPAALLHPWKWAAVHAVFIAGISVACLVTWRLNEVVLEQRRRAEERLRQETRIVEMLNDVGRTLAAELDLRSVVQRVTDAATELTPAAFGAFFYNVEDANGESFMLYTISGAPLEAFAGLGMPRNTPLFGPTFQGEGIVRIDDVLKDERYGKVPPHHGMPPGHLPVRSYLAVPVRSRTGRVIGGLFFGHPEPGRFTEVDERIVEGIAAHAAVAIDNASLYDAERSARTASEAAQRRLAVMAEASRILSSSLELDVVMQEVADLLVPSIAQACTIDVADADGRTRCITASSGVEAHRALTLMRERAGDATGPVHRAMSSRSPIDSDAWFDAAGLVGTRAITVPLARRGQAFGALTIVSTPDSHHPFGTGDHALAEELAGRVAIAVENMQLYDAQRSAAETLQHSLLPEELPRLPGLEMTARYVPGGPGAEVGGDWYDVLLLRDGHLGIAMGDVVGRGVPAASLMGQLRNAARAFAFNGYEPSRLIGSLNDLLFEVSGGDLHFATMVYAVYDPESGAVRVTNAGHPPPLVVGPRGDVRFLEDGLGPPVGAIPGVRYPETLVALAAGSALILYTDGLVEDRKTPLDDGLERLRLAVSSGPDDLDRLCDSLLTLPGAQDRHDDVAVLAVRTLPLGDVFLTSLPPQPAMLKALRATLRRWLREGGATEEETYEILVAIGEACANAIQHANLGSTPFELEAARDGGIRIRVRDSGSWRTPRKTIGGRGFGIMERFMDDLSVTTDPSGTEVVMRRALAGAGNR